jgi:hypothetical protein
MMRFSNWTTTSSITGVDLAAARYLVRGACGLVFVMMAFFTAPAQASSLWLWGWLGVSNIQLVQDSCGSSVKDPVTPVNSAATATVKKTASAPAKKETARISALLIEDSRRKVRQF